MKRISNYHTHCKLCHHAVGEIEDYIKRAILLGYKEIGMSDHGPLIEAFQKEMNSQRMTHDDYQKLYLPELKRLTKEYQDQIKILKAVEIEYLEDSLTFYDEFKQDLDYLVLGQHFIKTPNGYKSIYGKVDEADLLIYARTVEEALATKKFKILAHPDLFLWSYRRWDNTAIEISKRIIKACIKNQVYIELNCNGIRLSRMKSHFMSSACGSEVYTYPNFDFWSLPELKDAKVVISDDAHDPLNLQDAATIEAIELAKSLNLNIVELIEI